MAEPTNTQLLDALMNLSLQVGLLATAVDDARATLALHRQDTETRLTALDLALRNEITLNRTDVNTKIDTVNATQVSGDTIRTAIRDRIEAMHTVQDNLRDAIILIISKLNALKNQQDLDDEAIAALNLKLDDIKAVLDAHVGAP